MVIDWSKLLAALLLLLPPMPLFHGRKVRYRLIEHEWSQHWTRMLTLGLHTIDFLRAILGSLLLVEAMSAPVGHAATLKVTAILISGAALAAGVLLQTIVCKQVDAAHAPFAFVAGIAAGSLPPVAAGFVLLLALAITTGARMAIVFFPALALSVAVVGAVLIPKKQLFQLGPVAFAVLIPSLVVLLFPRDLVVAYRARAAGESGASPKAERQARAVRSPVAA